MGIKPVGIDDTTGGFLGRALAWLQANFASTATASVVLIYSSGAYPARPSVAAGLVTYKGPTQPTTWLTGDTWVVV